MKVLTLGTVPELVAFVFKVEAGQYVVYDKTIPFPVAVTDKSGN